MMLITNSTHDVDNKQHRLTEMTGPLKPRHAEFLQQLMAEYGGARLTKVGEKVNTNMVLIFTDRKMSTLGKTVKNHQVLLSNSFVFTVIFPGT